MKYYINNLNESLITKNKSPYKTIHNEVILTEDGLIKIKDDSYIKHVFEYKEPEIYENFHGKNDLYIDKSYFKKSNVINQIPFNHKKIRITYKHFSINKSQTYFVLEYINDNLKDYYFFTPKNIDFNIVENDILRFLSC
jgi:hypothetical protein